MTRAFAATSALFIASVATLVTILLPATDLTRFRNSLLATVGQPADFEWTPDAYPADFKLETAAPPDELLAAVRAIRTHADDAEHLMTSLVEHLRSKPKKRGPIKSTTLHAYREIIEQGRGYCADYTQVFNGLANTAHLPVREWGMAFDGFGGDGHAFNEIYDEDLGQWIFVDPMNGFYVRDRATGRPLSALEFRERTTRPDGFDTISIERIVENFLFPSDRAAFDYYARGADQLYLWFGNNVFTYDNHPVVRALSWSRALEGLAAIALGVHPEIRIYPTGSNAAMIESLLRLPYYVFGLTILSALLGLSLLIQVYLMVRRRRRPLAV
ncbi:MAG TPA: transglutaminase-like domain-containing protein [Gammaproteobacteria bacterium]